MESWCITYALIVVAAILGYGGYEAIPWRTLNSTDWASWVQAIGSIVAVGAAGGIAVYQNRMMRKNAVEDRALEIAQRQKSIYAIAAAALELVEEVATAYAQERSSVYFDLQYRPSAFQHAETALKAIPLHDMHSYSLVTGTLKLTDAVSGTARMCAIESVERNPLADSEQYSVAVEDLVTLARSGFDYVEYAARRANYLQMTGKYPEADPLAEEAFDQLPMPRHQ